MNKCFIAPLIIFLGVQSFFCLAQSDLVQMDPVFEEDTLSGVYHYFDLAGQYKESDVEKAIAYNKQALKLANENGSKFIRARVNELMGELFSKKNNFQPAINYYLIASKIFSELGDKENLIKIYGDLGMLYYENNYDLNKSSYYYQQALGYAIQLDKKDLIADVYNKLGGVFYNQADLEEAEHYFNNAYDIWKKTRNKKGMAIALNNIAEIRRLNNDLEKALELYNQCITLNKEQNNLQYLAINYENIGLVKSKQDKFNEALEYFRKSLDLFERINDTENKVELLILIGNESLKQKENAKAQEAFQEAYTDSKKYNHWIHIVQSSLGLSKVFEAEGDYARALHFFKINARYTDSIRGKEKKEQVAIVQTELLNNIRQKEINQKDSNIQLLEKEKKVNVLQRNLLAVAIFFVVILAVFIIIRLRQQAKRERVIREKDAQLHAAQQELMALKLENKSHDLSNFALHVVEKNRMLKELSHELSRLAQSANDETSRKLTDLNKTIRQGLNIQQDMKEFQHRVDESYGDFFIKLNEKFPNLTKNENRLCALLRLNLSSKEIAELNNTSVKAVEMSRYRLRKKCKLEFKELLNDYLQNL